MNDEGRGSPGWVDSSPAPTVSVERLLDGISEGVVAFDAEWRFTYVNRSAAAHLRAFTSVSVAELIGKDLWATFPGLVGTPIEASYRRAAAGCEIVELELCSAVTDRWLTYRAMPTAGGLTVFFRDITAEKRGRDALRASESRLRSVFENSLEGIVVMAPTGEIYDANPAACRIFGRSRDEILHGGAGSLVDTADPAYVAYQEQRRRDGRAFSELVLMRGDGTRFPAAVQSAMFLDETGQQRTITTFHDLSVQRGLEREQARTLVVLRNTEEQLRLTLDDAPIGMAVAGLDGRCVHANQRLADVLGYSAVELTSLTFEQLTHPDDREKDLALAASLRRGEIARYEIPKRFVRKDGVIVDTVLSSSLVRGAGGEPRLFIFQIQDLREKKRLEEQLTVSDKMASIGTLASGIAHEINNPLAHVLLNLELLAEDLSGGGAASEERVLRLASRVVDARVGAERIRTIVRAIEMFRRTDAARRAPVDVGAVLDLAVNLSANELRHRAVLVKECVAMPRVLADESRLEQVFVNLLVNAAQAIPEGHAASNEIRVATWTDAQGRAVVEVRDTGAGIPQHLLERIFDPFFTTKAVGLGTGLGLSISHAVVASLGGSLEVQSEVGKGTTFRVVLPGCAPVVDATPKAPPVDTSAPRRRGRVLVIDDEEAMGLLLEHGLGKEHTTTSLTSPRDALEQLEAGERFDVILCDVMMPDLSGPALYQLVRKFAPDQAARIIFMTGAAFSSTDWTFLDGTTHPTLRKPFVLQAVRDAVRAIVG
ncbi:MAG: PAS domain S-box protein [Byssovorax sp.]